MSIKSGRPHRLNSELFRYSSFFSFSAHSLRMSAALERNRIECFFNKLKQFRLIATRYGKLQTTFLSAVCLVSAFLIANNS